MNNYKTVVEKVMAELNYPNRKIDSDGKERGSFAVTKECAIRINRSYPSCGLLKKPSGNNIDGYSVDCLFFKDEAIVDIIGASGSPTSSATWQVNTDNLPSSDKWQNPNIFVTNPPVDNPPVDETNTDLIALLTNIPSAIEELNTQINELKSLILSNHEDISNRIAAIKGCIFRR